MPGQGSSPRLTGDAPVEIAGDASILQTVAVIQPLPGDRGRQNRPVGLAVDPVGQLLPQIALLEVEVLGLPHFEVGRAGNRGTRLDEVDRVELLGAVFTLNPRARVHSRNFGQVPSTYRVGQEAIIRFGVELIFGDFLDQSGLGELSREMLRQPVVLRARRPAVLVEREGESVRKVLLDGPHFRAVFRYGLARLVRRELCMGVPCSSVAQRKRTSCPPGAHVAGIQVPHGSCDPTRLPRCLIPLM